MKFNHCEANYPMKHGVNMNQQKYLANYILTKLNLGGVYLHTICYFMYWIIWNQQATLVEICIYLQLPSMLPPGEKFL